MVQSQMGFGNATIGQNPLLQRNTQASNVLVPETWNLNPILGRSVRVQGFVDSQPD